MSKKILTIQNVVDSYKVNRESIRGTAEDLGISRGTVRKILITEGVYVPPMAEQINDLKAGGKTVAEIAEIMGMSRSAVATYLPYTKGSYAVGEKSENALKIRKTRENKAAERNEKKSTKIAK